MKNRLVIFAFTAFISAHSLAQDTTRLSLLFLGDVMQHDSQIADAYDPKTNTYDYNPGFEFVKPYVQSADIAIGNLEITLAGRPYKGYPQFSAPDELLLGLKTMGVDVLVTANNHCVDRGRKGLERTIHMLDSFQIPHTGTFVDEVTKLNEQPLMIERNGFNLALLNYTYGTNGLPVSAPNIVNLLDTTAMGKDIVYAKKKNPDAIIVFVHWGAEYQSLPSKSQVAIGEFCFRKGAQLVIGAHPHVIQPMQHRKEKNQLIAYSLGNFVSGQRKRYTDGGAMLATELQKVVFPDGSSITTIDTSNYILEWVYRTNDNEMNYFVLPAPSFEGAESKMIKDGASREAFKVFLDDSRSLLNKHNIGISEQRSAASNDLVTYRVLSPFPSDSLSQHMPDLFYYPAEKVTISEGGKGLISGEFLQKRAAERYLKKVIDAGYPDARIVKFVNGKQD